MFVCERDIEEMRHVWQTHVIWYAEYSLTIPVWPTIPCIYFV